MAKSKPGKGGTEPRRTYPIGYKKPPQNQFKPGECGNPKGRPRKIRAEIADIIRAIWDEKVELDNGKITKKEAIARALVAKSYKDPKLALDLFRCFGKSPEASKQELNTEEVRQRDQKILENYRDRVLRQAEGSAEGTKADAMGQEDGEDG